MPTLEKSNMCLSCNWVGAVGTHVPVAYYESTLKEKYGEDIEPPTDEERKDGHMTFMELGAMSDPLFCPLCGEKTLISFGEGLESITMNVKANATSKTCGRA